MQGMRRGKITRTDGIELPDRKVVKGIEEGDHKYLKPADLRRKQCKKSLKRSIIGDYVLY